MNSIGGSASVGDRLDHVTLKIKFLAHSLGSTYSEAVHDDEGFGLRLILDGLADDLESISDELRHARGGKSVSSTAAE